MDEYHPSKYGIIFKEKIIVSPTDHTQTSMSIKLYKDGKEYSKIQDNLPKYFRVDIFDNGRPIYC